MNGWIKKFSDNSVEVGSDADVEAKKASWSKGRLDDMVGAEIIHNSKKISIEAPGSYWQSDDYEVNIFHPDSELVIRRLQYKLKEGKIFQMLESKDVICFTQTDEHDDLWESLIGQWLTIELNVRTGEFYHYLRETPK